MKTEIEHESDSIVRQVRRLKEENAAEHGFDLRRIAAAARSKQKLHPERMVSRMPVDEKPVPAGQSLTRPATEEEL
jgi:hypothetical protein